MNKIDVVSDLHIDQWDEIYNIKYPCGIVKNNPIKFDKNSEILVIAGDISDDIERSLDYLDKLSKNYEFILFVDGNHEHVNVYPYLYEKNEIIDKINKFNNPKLIYLPNKYFIVNKTVFIGVNGWWNYNNNNSESKKKSKNYFKKWIPKLDEIDSNIFINQVLEKSEEDFLYLKKSIEKFENNSDIESIIIVTHTVPITHFLSERDIREFDTLVNTKFLELHKYKKISKWIFGHTHGEINEKFDDIEFICYPRGRPEDYKRENYKINTITV